jgi:hypothetical protein
MSFTIAAGPRQRCLSRVRVREVHEDIWGSGRIVPPFLASALDGGE